MPFAQQGPAGYQDSMVPFGEWLPDAARNIKPGFPLFWVNGSPVQLDDALNVIWTAGAYRPYGSPVALAATMASAPLAAFATYSPVLVVVAGTVSGLYWSDNYNVAAWTACGGGYTASDWSFTQYGQCVYAADGHDPIQVMDVTDLAAGFTALAASTAPVAKCLGVIRDFVVAGNIVSSPIGAPTGPNVIQWCGLAAPATWDLPNTQQARADQSGAQSLYAQYGAVQYIANGEELGMVFQQTGITRVQYVGGDVVFSFYTFERKRGLVNPHAAAQVGNTVFFLSSDGFYATDGTQVQPIGYGKVNRWFLADCTNLLAVQSAADVVNQCIVWNYPSASNPSGQGQMIYNFGEGQWSRGNYPCALLYQDFASAGGIQQYQPAGFNAAHAVIRFDGTPTNSELVTDYFRFDPSHRALVVSVRPMCDDPNTTAGVSARVQDGDPDYFVGYGNPEPVSQQISVRADGYAHAVNVKMGQSFTYCQGCGVRYTLRGSR